MTAWKKPKDEVVELLSRELDELDCEQRKMFGYPVYFVNDNMFMGVHGENMFMRLSSEDRIKILEEREDVVKFTPVKGRTMREYVTIPRTLYEDLESFRFWRDRSFAFVSSLPPKAKKKRNSK